MVFRLALLIAGVLFAIARPVAQSGTTLFLPTLPRASVRTRTWS